MCRHVAVSSPNPAGFGELTSGGGVGEEMQSDQLIEVADNPLDVVEEIVTAHEWSFERETSDELSVCIGGGWCDYHLGFTHNPHYGGLQVACAYDVRVPARKRTEVCSLLAMVNERLWLGHFDLWSEEGIPMFRHVLLTVGDPSATAGQVERMIEIAITECERYYPAFQFVLWGGKSAEDAVAAAMFETMGEA